MIINKTQGNFQYKATGTLSLNIQEHVSSYCDLLGTSRNAKSPREDRCHNRSDTREHFRSIQTSNDFYFITNAAICVYNCKDNAVKAVGSWTPRVQEVYTFLRILLNPFSGLLEVQHVHLFFIYTRNPLPN